MAERMNKAPETREQVDTNEANLLENTRGRLAEILEQVWKIPEGLKSFAERFKFDKKTWWAVFLSAMIFASGTSVAHASENSQAILDRAISSWDSEWFVVQMFKNKDYEELRQLADRLWLDPNLIRDCQKYDDFMEEVMCNADMDDKETKMIGEVLAAEEEQLAAEEEQLAAEEEQLAAEEEQLREYERMLWWHWDNANTILWYIEWEHNDTEAVREAIDYIRSNEDQIRDALWEEWQSWFDELLNNLNFVERQLDN